MSGVLHGVIASLKAAAAAATDAFFEYVTLLLNTTSTNGAQNNTFLDSSTNNFTVTRNGDTTQGSFNPYMPSGYWSGYFDGTGDYLSAASNAAFAFGTGDFTAEAWIFRTATPTYTSICAVGNGVGGFGFVVGGTGDIYVARAGIGFDNTFTANVPANQWAHIAVSRSGTSIYCFVNGTQIGSAQSNTTNYAQGALTVGIDGNGSGSPYTGYISNFRLVKGTAVYTAAFTPPTTPLTAITNTSLLCLQDNRFKDNSTNAFAITRNGDTRISKLAPFNPPASYSTASYGGSGYFDGTGDYLGIADGAALDLNSTYTLEYWFYQPAAGDGVFFGRGGGASSWSNINGLEYATFILTGTFYYQFNNGSGSTPAQITTTAPASGQWHHVAVGYNGTTTRVWVDGASIGTSTSAYSLPTTRNITRVGLSPDGTLPLTGYVSNLRVVKGTDVYGVGNTTITPPTTPLTAITNTSLLLNFTNAGIYDAATINDAQTVGNAQVSTTQAKFGTTSMYFDGAASSRLVFPARPEIAFGTGNFTIEGWVYRADTNNRGVFQISGTTGGLVNSTLGNLALSSETGQVWQIYCNNSNYLSTATWSTNTWYHFALVRNSGTTKLYIDGTSVISQADTTNYTGQNLCVGGYYSTVFVMNGYIQDLRITNGYARYTANFTPPTAAFPTS